MRRGQRWVPEGGAPGPASAPEFLQSSKTGDKFGDLTAQEPCTLLLGLWPQERGRSPVGYGRTVCLGRRSHRPLGSRMPPHTAASQ